MHHGEEVQRPLVRLPEALRYLQPLPVRRVCLIGKGWTTESEEQVQEVEREDGETPVEAV